MAKVYKIDSNIVGVRYAVEESPKKLPSNPVWHPVEANSFSGFGAELTMVSRKPISPGRQVKKGSVVDLNASGGFSGELTQESLQDLFQGFFFADYQDRFRVPADRLQTARITATAAGSIYGYTGDMSGLHPGALVYVTGFTNAGNNGMKTIKTVNKGTGVAIKEKLVDEVADKASMTLVGVVASTGDVSIEAAAGEWPKLVVKNATFTGSPFKAGQWIHIGGDTGASSFASDTNNGYKRIRKVEEKAIYFDKYDQPMVDDNGSGKDIEIYFGRDLRNEVGTKIRQRTYQIERTLGAPDPTKPDEQQSEYIVGARANEITINMPEADMVTVDMSFVATDAEQRNSTEGLKAGDRPVLISEDAFNTSTDYRRIRLAKSPADGDSFQPLFTFVTDLTITINNNVTPLKALGVLGAFDSTSGDFMVSGSLTAYFADVEAVRAVRNHEDITLDFIIAKENKAIIFDMPLMGLGNGQVTIEKDAAIKLPLDFTAADASKLNPETDYTVMMSFFDYLPDRAASGTGVN